MHAKPLAKLLILALVWAAALAAGGAAAQAQPIRIVTTTPDLASLARAVAGDLAAVSSISDGRDDPHFLQAKPSYALAARDADLWVRVGLELEVGWEPPLLEGARRPDLLPGGPRHLDASEKALKLDIPSGPISRDMGDVHPLGNPHWWLDPVNARLAAYALAQRLSQLYPAHAPAFETNLAAFERRLDEAMFGPALVARLGGNTLWSLELTNTLAEYLAGEGLASQLGGWKARLAAKRGAPLVIYHKSWVYLTNRFGLAVAAELEPKPGIPPSGGHIAQVVRIMRERGVKVILQEPFYPRNAADLAARQTGAQVLILPNTCGGLEGGQDYLALMNLLVDRLAEAL
ncbi:MAG: metal ABC transporter substrate-binding protein [Thermodesulfobacteriota bacterium]